LCFVQSSTKGNLFTTATQDADHHIVPMAYSMMLANESTNSWGTHLKFVEHAYPKVYAEDAEDVGDDDVPVSGFDTPNRRHIMDCDKGSHAAWQRHTEFGLLFACSHHRVANVAIHARKAGKEAYLKALNAPTVELVQGLKAGFDPKTAGYLGKLKDYEQYMACAGGMRGNKTSGIAESLNGANIPVRHLDMCPALMKLGEETKRRYDTNKALAWAHKGVLPSKVEEKVKAEAALAEKYPQQPRSKSV